MSKQEQINIEKIFFKFLKDNNALKEYKSNLINTLLNTRNGKENIILTYVNPMVIVKQNKSYYFLGDRLYTFYENLINLSCRWDETKEGFDFWASLHRKWKELLKNLICEFNLKKNKCL